MTSASDEGEEDKEEKKDDKTLVGVVHSEVRRTYEDFGAGSLGPSFYL